MRELFFLFLRNCKKLRFESIKPSLPTLHNIIKQTTYQHRHSHSYKSHSDTQFPFLKASYQTLILILLLVKLLLSQIRCNYDGIRDKARAHVSSLNTLKEAE